MTDPSKPTPVIYHGGMYRCCVQNILEAPDRKDTEGSQLRCPHCDHTVEFHKGGWRSLVHIVIPGAL